MRHPPQATASPYPIVCEKDLVAIAVALGARQVPTLSRAEQALTRDLSEVPAAHVDPLRHRIRAGDDPLGEIFCRLRSAEARRPQGATYTPPAIVDAMVSWAQNEGTPQRIVDPGAGSARFLINAGRKFPAAQLLAIELDPLGALMARANIAVTGLAPRSQVIVRDYRELVLEPTAGPTLFIGNPPYVRHHLLGERWKTWLAQTAKARGAQASQLAGLHVHFFLSTLTKASPGDYGAFITAAEWLDVNYGRLVRELLLGDLGGQSIHVIEPTAAPFPDAAATAAITCFQVGAQPRSLKLRRVSSLDDLGTLDGGRLVRRERLEASQRWTPLTRPARKGPEGFVELGELCRVHRGQVTGANKIWVTGSDTVELPASVLFASVTKARELFAAGAALLDPTPLRRVIDLPPDLDGFEGEDRKLIDRFLRKARAAGAHQGYIAQTRKAWWSVGLREPAPILSTYMARRPPAFVRNVAQARHINIAHGLYPRESLNETALSSLAIFLSSSTSITQGRTYAGGLTKFEPKEMERLLVPGPELLARAADAMMIKRERKD